VCIVLVAEMAHGANLAVDVLWIAATASLAVNVQRKEKIADYHLRMRKEKVDALARSILENVMSKSAQGTTKENVD
jgi:hypothetical protein